MTINRTPQPRLRPATTGAVPAEIQEEGMANTITVRVRVLRSFDGAATERGTHVKPYTEGDVLDVPAALASLFIANGDAEQVDEDTPATDDVDTDTVDPGEAASQPDLRAWITSEKTTGKAVVEWLAEQGVSVQRGLRVPDIKGIALDVVERHEAEVAQA